MSSSKGTTTESFWVELEAQLVVGLVVRLLAALDQVEAARVGAR